MSRSNSSLESASVSATVCALERSSASSSSREAIVRDNAERPSSALRTCSSAPSKVSPRVRKLSASCSVSMAPAVAASCSKAAVTSYGVVVRLNGMGSSGSSTVSPVGCRARYFCPNNVLILISAVVRLPIQASETRKETRTRSSASSTSVTSPTLIPATRTSLDGTSPAASANSA